MICHFHIHSSAINASESAYWYSFDQAKNLKEYKYL